MSNTDYEQMPTLDKMMIEMISEIIDRGQAMERRWKEDLKLILRLTPDRESIQLVVVGTYRHADNIERSQIREAFDIPADIRPEFSYQRGYGIMQLTWPLPDWGKSVNIPQQIAMWDLSDYEVCYEE